MESSHTIKPEEQSSPPCNWKSGHDMKPEVSTTVGGGLESRPMDSIASIGNGRNGRKSSRGMS